MSRIADSILAFLQRRCQHPSWMVASDIMEGSGGDYQIGYCRRCGGVQIRYNGSRSREWRLPNPNLWR